MPVGVCIRTPPQRSDPGVREERFSSQRREVFTEFSSQEWGIWESGLDQKERECKQLVDQEGLFPTDSFQLGQGGGQPVFLLQKVQVHRRQDARSPQCVELYHHGIAFAALPMHHREGAEELAGLQLSRCTDRGHHWGANLPLNLTQNSNRDDGQ